MRFLYLFVFSSNPSCEKTCRPKSTYHYDYDELECTEICRKDRGGGSYFSLLLFFIVVGVFVTSLVNAVITARGCCNCCRCCECSESRRQGPDQGLLFIISCILNWIKYGVTRNSLTCCQYCQG